MDATFEACRWTWQAAIAAVDGMADRYIDHALGGAWQARTLAYGRQQDGRWQAIATVTHEPTIGNSSTGSPVREGHSYAHYAH